VSAGIEMPIQHRCPARCGGETPAGGTCLSPPPLARTYVVQMARQYAVANVAALPWRGGDGIVQSRAATARRSATHKL